MTFKFSTSHNTRGLLICLAVTLLVLFNFARGNFVNLENRAIDFRFNFRGDRPLDPSIVVVTIDEESMAKLGRWPWPRRLHAKLTRILDKAGAKSIAFDSLFSEVDSNDPSGDIDFAKAAEETGLVATAFHFKGKIVDGIFGELPLFPYPKLAGNCYLGFVNHEPDGDGVTRRANLYAINDKSAYPSLAVVALALSEDKTMEEKFKELPVVVTADTEKAKNNLFINYVGRDHYPEHSYSSVLKGEFNPEDFKDKIVFIGATAAALGDLKATPFSSLYPGVMLHATIVDNLIHQNFMKEGSIEGTLFYILFVGLILGIVLPRLGTFKKLLVFVAIVGGGVAFGLWLFSSQNIVLHMVPPLFTGLGCYAGLLFYQVVIEEREKRKIKGSFKQYLSPKIIDIITKDPSKLKLGGEEKTVTIFFLDIAGFTNLSELLGPTQLVEVMNECLTTFSDIILKHDGLINKYIGDCIMAFWNAPADQPKHASQACLAALDCIKSLPAINAEFEKRGLPKTAKIDCRVGINTGIVVVGNMGSKEKFDYTVMGDPVNVASRLEGANKEYHSHIMISDTTFEQAKDDIETRDLDLIKVKGKTEPRKVFELLARKGEMSEAVLKGRDLYHQGLKLYRQQQFEEAIQTFQEVFDYLPSDHLTLIYQQRARTFKINPPAPSWDGVFEMKTK